MKKIPKSVLIALVASFLSINIHAQEKVILPGEILRNSLSTYIGLFEFNLNYERYLIRRPNSLTNMRLGVGKGMFVTAGDGFYLNPALVHMIGSRNSHLELDLGFKYIVNYKNPDNHLSLYLIPDIFAGYRYDKPDGEFIFRIGINYPTLINIGVGIKL